MNGRAALLPAVLLAAIGLRAWEQFSSSLWLDELHSLAHAGARDVPGVLEHVHWDSHAPLYFVALHFLRGICPEIQRTVSVLANLLVLVPLLVFARRSRLGAAAVPLAAALFATLPFQIQYATELRPYAWLMLASACAACAAFTDAGSRTFRFALFAASVAFGLLTHYLMAFTVVLIGLARLACLLPPRRAQATSGQLLGFGWLVLAGAIGALAFLPWVFGYVDWAIADPAEIAPPREGSLAITAAHVADLAQAPFRMLVPQIRSLGAPWTAITVAGAALLALGLLASSACWLRRAVRRDVEPAAVSTRLAVTFALLSLIILGVSIWGWERVALRYLCMSAWLWPLFCCEFVAAARTPHARAALAALLVAGSTLAGIGHAGGVTRENVRGAVAVARRAGEGLLAADPSRPPHYTAFLHQPPRFEHGTLYDAYAPDLDCVELKPQIHAGPQRALLPAPGEPGFERPVVVVTRRAPDLAVPPAPGGPPELVRLLTGRRVLRKTPVDGAMTVWILGPQ